MFYEVLRKRWPDIGEQCEFSENQQLDYEFLAQGEIVGLRINGIQLASLYDAYREAELQASRIPDNQKFIYLYGLGTGDLARSLLRRPGLKKLYIILLNTQMLRIVDKVFPLDDIVADERVEMILAKECEEVQKPFAASPSCLSLADPQSKKLADKVFLELGSEYNTHRHQDSDSWMAQQLAANDSLLDLDGTVDELLAEGLDEVIVVGSGPSLEMSLDWIRDNESKTIIAADSALKPLLQAGISPNIVVAIDPHGDYVGKHLDVDPQTAKAIDLVYFPVVRNDVLRAWPGRRFIAYPDHALYQGFAKRFPQAMLFASGSVIHPAIDLAVRMGATSIYLAGVDFAFIGDNTHAQGSSFKRELNSKDTLPGVFTTIINGEGVDVKTQTSFLGYLSDLESYINKTSDVKFINLSRKGAMIKGTIYSDVH